MTTESNHLERLEFDSSASHIASLLRCNSLFVETDLAALKRMLSRGQMLALRPGDVLLRFGAHPCR
jgi:hypothetical protein